MSSASNQFQAPGEWSSGIYWRIHKHIVSTVPSSFNTEFINMCPALDRVLWEKEKNLKQQLAKGAKSGMYKHAVCSLGAVQVTWL